MKKILLIITVFAFIIGFNIDAYSQARASVTFHRTGATYRLNDLVSVDGVIYKCIVAGISTPPSANWEDVTSAFSETDPIWTASDAFGITTQNRTDWTSAFNWGDHALVGYALSGAVPTNLGDLANVTDDTRLTNEVLYYSGTAWENLDPSLLALISDPYGIGWSGATTPAMKGDVYTKIEAIAGGAESTTVSDTPEIDLTLTGSDITAAIVLGSIDETKLDVSTNASLDLADSALQSEVDGSPINEIQTIANTSDATTHTATLSLAGGSVQFVEGTGIELTTGGSAQNGTLTIASTSTGATNLGYTASGTDGTVTSDTGADATLPAADGTNAGLLLPAHYNVLLNTSNTNSGDQTSIVGITGTKAEFNTAVTDGAIDWYGQERVELSVPLTTSDAIDGFKIVFVAGTPSLTLDDATITVPNFELYALNNTGADLSLAFGGTDSSVQTAPAVIPNGEYIYAEHLRADTWSISVGGAAAGGGTDDQIASEVPFTPYLTIASTDVQAAIQELLDEAGTGVTNLGYTASPTDGTVTSSTGTNATIPLATGVNAGLLAPADFSKVSTVGLVRVTETNSGYRLANESAANHTDIGAEAIDMTVSFGVQSGAAADYSAAIGGVHNTLTAGSDAGAIIGGAGNSVLNAYQGVIIGGSANTIASGVSDGVIIGGNSLTVNATSGVIIGNGAITSTGINGVAMGGGTAAGTNAVSIGAGSEAPSWSEVALGSWPVTYTPTSRIAYSATDRLFSLSAGTSAGARATRMIVLKSGATTFTSSVTANSLVASTTVTAANYRVSNLNAAPATATSAGVAGEVRFTATHIYVCTATNVWVRAALTTW